MRVTIEQVEPKTDENSLQLHVLEDGFMFVNQQGHSLHMTYDGGIAQGGKGLTVSRLRNNTISYTSRLEINWEPPKDTRSYQIHGIIGILEGARGNTKRLKLLFMLMIYILKPIEKYLVVITRVQSLGQIFGHSIYVIEQVACLQFDAHKARAKLDSKVNIKKYKIWGVCEKVS